jgi:hypothetical protein
MTEPTPDPTPVEPVNPAPTPPVRPQEPPDDGPPPTGGMRRPRPRSVSDPQGYEVGGVVPPGNAYTPDAER